MGKGSGLGGGKEHEWIKEKKNNPSLRTGLEPRPAPGHRWGRSEPLRAAGRPGGPWAGPAGGSLVSGLGEPAWARTARSGGHRWRPGARRRLGSGRGEAG